MQFAVPNSFGSTDKNDYADECRKKMKLVFEAKIHVTEGTDSNVRSGASLEHAAAYAAKNALVAYVLSLPIPRTRLDLGKWVVALIEFLDGVTLAGSPKHFRVQDTSPSTAVPAFEAMRSHLLLIFREALWELNF